MNRFLSTLVLYFGSVLTTHASVISVNFNQDQRNQLIAPSSTAGHGAHKHWNNTGGKARGSHAKLLDNKGRVTAAELKWSANLMWSDITANTDANSGKGNAQLRRGYLDDSGGSPSFTVRYIPYTHYHVVLYFSSDTDGGTYRPATINGTKYRTTFHKKTYANDKTWSPANSIIAKDLTGTLTVNLNGRKGNSRASLAGFQIINTMPPATSTLIGFGNISLSLQSSR